MSYQKGENKTSSTQTRDPWSPAQPHLKHALSEARRIYESDLGKRYFPGQSVTQYAPQYLQGLQQIEDRAIGGDPNVNLARQQLTDIQKNNPYQNLEKFWNPYQSQILSDMNKRVGAAVNRQFGAAGRGGSLAHQRGLADAIADATTRANFQGYNQAGNLAGQYVNSVLGMQQPALMMGQQPYQSGQALMGVGQAHQDQQAREIADRMARYNFGQQMPLNRLGDLYNMASHAGGLGGTMTGTQTQRSSQSGFNLNQLGNHMLGTGFNAGVLGMMKPEDMSMWNALVGKPAEGGKAAQPGVGGGFLGF